MKQLTTVFAVHNHQPIGNFPSIFEHAFEVSYRPFFDVLERHPSVKFTQHWTGPLLEWLFEQHPEFIDRMRELVRRGQLELLTGAYYEAILAVIPEHDVLGQIHKLTETIVREFGTTPRGMWLAERVWEPHLVRLIREAGVEFVVLDDTHFRYAGLAERQIDGHHLTEEGGATLNVFPINGQLRYTIPFQPVETTLRYFRSRLSDGGGVLVHADDGEKFGVWPGTHKTVFEEGWLEAYCSVLDENRDWLHTSHLGELVDRQPNAGRVYFPTATYPEMMKWALWPVPFQHLDRFEHQLKLHDLYDSNAAFVRGGFWRNFLAKYPEANHMHKKMLRISRRAELLAKQRAVPQEVFDHLWAGQCNDAYWHGVFGGLYLPNLRHATYSNLLKAERLLDSIEHLPPVRIERSDLDCDGVPELLVESDPLNLYFTPSVGGSLVELDFKPAAVNLLDVISRREEGYHHRLRDTAGRQQGETTVHDGVRLKEDGLQQYLHTDWYRRGSLIDHFFGPGTQLDAFARCEYWEMGDFVNQPYVPAVWSDGKEIEITLTRDGALWNENRPHRVRVRKLITFKGGDTDVIVDYAVTNRERAPLEIWFGVEFNVGLMAGDAHDRYYEIEGRVLDDRRLRSAGEETGVQNARLVDEWLGVEMTLQFDRPATLWRCPIETVSLSESGFERLYQSSVIVPHWKCQLQDGPADEFRVRIVQSLRSRGR